MKRNTIAARLDIKCGLKIEIGLGLVAAIIFTFVALIHLLRIIYHWEIIISGYLIPMSASTIALIITGIIVLWMFIAAEKNQTFERD